LVRTEEIAARNDPIDRVPLRRLVGEACVIDIPAHGRANLDYLITVDDVLAWEAVGG
jgi:kynurenine formamidase